MKKYLLLLCLSVLLSCSPDTKVSYYSYNGVTVTRIDEDTDIRFYYGKIEDFRHPPDSFLRATYRGRDGFMEAYLIFEKEKGSKIRTVGIFKRHDSHLIVLKDITNTDIIKWKKRIALNHENVLLVDSYIPAEQKYNSVNRSKVKASYYYSN